MRSVLPVLAMIAALVAMPVAADEPGDFEIYGLSLGQRAPDPSDLGGLQAAFGPFIAKDIKGLMLVEQPVAHYLLDFGNDQMLGVWFDGTSKDRPIYWLDLTERDRTRPSAHPSRRGNHAAWARAARTHGHHDRSSSSGGP